MIEYSQIDIKKAGVIECRLKLVYFINSIGSARDNGKEYERFIESYELLKRLRLILDIFNEKEKLELKVLEEYKFKSINKKHKKILRTLKLLKIKFEL